MKLRIYRILLLVLSTGIIGCAEPGAGRELQTELCRWNSAVPAGALDPEIINEASGMAISDVFSDRIYHINDSGDSGRFYVTDISGGDTGIVNVDGFEPRDVEDLALGECGTVAGTCLFIADIGDNARARDEIEVVIVREQEQFGDSVAPVDRIRLRYPDGANDAESLAVHPNGDLFIVSKGADYSLLTVSPSKIYRLPLARRLEADGQVQELDWLGEVEFTEISTDTFSGSLPTAFDISSDGSRFLVLTYVNAFEFYMDLSQLGLPVTEDLVDGVDFREIPLEVLIQQESIAYLGENDFLYNTEAVDGTARIMRVRCRS